MLVKRVSAPGGVVAAPTMPGNHRLKALAPGALDEVQLGRVVGAAKFGGSSKARTGAGFDGLTVSKPPFCTRLAAKAGAASGASATSATASRKRTHIGTRPFSIWGEALSWRGARGPFRTSQN